MKVTVVGAGSVGSSCAEYIAIKRIDELRWSNGFYRKDIGYKVID